MSTRPRLSPSTRALIYGIDTVALHITRHWLLYGNLVLIIYIGLPVLAPVAMELGWTWLGDAIYRLYALNCHQLAYRSFFLFGRQAAYSLPELQAALNVTNPALDLGYWREFLGNSALGFKMAFCERDLSLYGSMILASIPFALRRATLRPLNWRLYLLFIAPMAVDGFWQLFSYTPLVSVLPFHESTPLLRLLTGALFGNASVWLLFPYVEEAMRDLRRDLAYQKTKIEAYAD